MFEQAAWTTCFTTTFQSFLFLALSPILWRSISEFISLMPKEGFFSLLWCELLLFFLQELLIWPFFKHEFHGFSGWCFYIWSEDVSKHGTITKKNSLTRQILFQNVWSNFSYVKVIFHEIAVGTWVFLFEFIILTHKSLGIVKSSSDCFWRSNLSLLYPQYRKQ